MRFPERRPILPLLWSLGTTWKERFRNHSGIAQTADITAVTPSAGHCSCQHIPGQLGAPTPQGHRVKRRLYIISRRASGAPARRSDRAVAVPSQPLPRGAVRGRCGGDARGDKTGRQGLAGVRGASPSPGWGAEGGLPAPGRPGPPPPPRRAGRATRSAATASWAQAGVPALPASRRLRARSSRLRPGPPRSAPVRRLT